MTWYRRSQKTSVQVAMVGSMQGEFEMMASRTMVDWLSDNDPEMLADFHYDHINLAQHRDFLRESRTYDLVAVCWIYQKPGENAGYFAVSDLHAPQNWGRRLSSTQAKYLFVFGWDTEINAQWLGAIAGYRLLPKAGTADVYARSDVDLQRNNLPEQRTMETQPSQLGGVS